MQFVAYVVRAPLCQRMPIVIGGSSGRPVVSGCAWEPRVTQPETFVEGRREILRQASIALGGRPVTVWEVTAPRITLATGHHDAWPLFANNDLPGILSLRGALRLLGEHGVRPGSQVVVHGPRIAPAIT